MTKQKLFEILKDLIKIPSPSSQEKVLANHISRTYGREGWELEQELEFNNILYTRTSDNYKEKLPLLLAHIDTHPNGDSQDNNKKLTEPDFLTLENGQVKKKHEIQAGFDDKAGVAAILYLMHNTDLKFRVLFVTQEERTANPNYDRKGGGGIDDALTSFPNGFKFASCVISLDRANSRDIIFEYGENDNKNRPRIQLCSPEFLSDFIKCSEKSGHLMSVAEGKMGDVYNIRRKYPELDCLNLSIGIYNEHKPEESIKIDETISVISVVENFLNDIVIN